jgi:hypothetical protein
VARTSGEDSMFDACVLYGYTSVATEPKNSKTLPPTAGDQSIDSAETSWAALIEFGGAECTSIGEMES